MASCSRPVWALTNNQTRDRYKREERNSAYILIYIKGISLNVSRHRLLRWETDISAVVRGGPKGGEGIFNLLVTKTLLLLEDLSMAK
jgi:hypothetical protein